MIERALCRVRLAAAGGILSALLHSLWGQVGQLVATGGAGLTQQTARNNLAFTVPDPENILNRFFLTKSDSAVGGKNRS